MGVRFDISFVREFLNNRNIELISEKYISGRKKIKCRCMKCFNEWGARFENIKLQGQGCPKCGIERRKNKRKLSYEYVKAYLLELKILFLENEYKNCTTKYNYRCLRCNCCWKTTFLNIRYNKSGCPQCAKIKRKITCLSKYGVDNVSKNKEIVAKTSKSLNNSYILYHWKTRRRSDLYCFL